MPHEVLIEAAAAARLRRLIAVDRVLERPRDQFVKAVWQRQYDKGKTDMPSLVYLLSCPWCISPYCGIVVLCLQRFPIGRFVVRVLAISEAVGLISLIESRLDSSRSKTAAGSGPAQ